MSADHPDSVVNHPATEGDATEEGTLPEGPLSATDPQVRAFTRDYLDFLSDSPTAFHAGAQAAERLEEVGFQAVDPTAQWPKAPGPYFLKTAGAVIAWVQFPGAQGFSLVAAHTDSPGLKLKPIAHHHTRDGWGQLLVETYGGLLYNSWLDRELRVAGAVRDRNGATHLITTGPVAWIPQLAPHLGREVNSSGLVLDPQRHLQPVWTIDEPDRDILEEVAHLIGLDSRDDLLASELFLTPAQEPGLFGLDHQFVAGARQDNLSSCFAGITALAQAWDQAAFTGKDGGIWPSQRMPVLALFDHEEIGSGTPTGARGPLLATVLRRVARAMGANGDQFEQMMACTVLISADAAHSVNPSYEEKHDPQSRPVLGRGPVLKVDADQRYVTSLDGIAVWREACDASTIPSQVFVSHSSLRAGSTVGPMLATQLGIPAVDVGVPLLSMHSTREMTHVVDPYLLAQAMTAYWTRMFTHGSHASDRDARLAGLTEWKE